MVKRRKNAKVEAITKFIDLIHKRMRTIKMIVADNGGAFKEDQLTEFLEASNIIRLETSAYPPKTNGTVERLNRSIIERL